MKKILPIVSFLALILIVLPPVLFLSGTMALEAMKSLMLLATLIWFLTTPFWMGRTQGDGKG